MEPFHEHPQEVTEKAGTESNECPICLEQITGEQRHCGQVVTCASTLHAFHAVCAAGITNNTCPLRCGPMVGQQANAHVGHNAVPVPAPVHVPVPAAQHHGVWVVPTGVADFTQAVVQGATVDVHYFAADVLDYQVYNGAVNAAAPGTQYDIHLADGSLLVSGVSVQANDGAGTYRFSAWADVQL
jgi:hypothetical protein